MGSSGDEHRFVSADCTHGRERVHALCTSGARHQLHRERRHTRLRDFLDNRGFAEGPQKSNEDLVTAEERHVFLAGDVVRPVTKHLHDDVGGRKYSSAVPHNLRALIGIVRVGVAGLDSCSGLNMHFEACFDKRWKHGWHERHPALSRINFFRNTDDQKFPACSAPLDLRAHHLMGPEPESLRRN